MNPSFLRSVLPLSAHGDGMSAGRVKRLYSLERAAYTTYTATQSDKRRRDDVVSEGGTHSSISSPNFHFRAHRKHK